jgi:hypothetical protein
MKAFWMVKNRFFNSNMQITGNSEAEVKTHHINFD